MKNIITLLFLLTYFAISAQEVTTCGGDFFSQANGSISWTLGEPISETYSGTSILTQGFQQNHQNILNLTESQTFNSFSIFPNPFNSEINIKLVSFGLDEFTIQIMDATGKLLVMESLFYSSADSSNQIDLSHLAIGIYFLKINYFKNKKSKIFKLNKN